jgi:hypothetical protein
MTASLFADLKVIDCASWIAGPAAATILSDFGADGLWCMNRRNANEINMLRFSAKTIKRNKFNNLCIFMHQSLSSAVSLTDCTAPNVTPAASRRVRQSAKSRWAKTVSSTCTSALACALRAALVAKRGSSARSGRPIAARNPGHCRGSLNSAMMNQRPSRHR